MVEPVSPICHGTGPCFHLKGVAYIRRRLRVCDKQTHFLALGKKCSNCQMEILDSGQEHIPFRVQDIRKPNFKHYQNGINK